MKTAKTITYQGRTQSIRAWAKEANIPYDTLRKRIKRGMSAEEAITQPMRQWKTRKTGGYKKGGRPEGCCLPDCQNCPLYDCRYDGGPTHEEVVLVKTAQKQLPDYASGMCREYHLFTSVTH